MWFIHTMDTSQLQTKKKGRRRDLTDLTLAVSMGVRTGHSILVHTLAVGAGSTACLGVFGNPTPPHPGVLTKRLVVLGRSERSHRDSRQ